MNWRRPASETLDKAGAAVLCIGLYLWFGSGVALVATGLLLMLYAYALIQ